MIPTKKNFIRLGRSKSPKIKGDASQLDDQKSENSETYSSKFYSTLDPNKMLGQGNSKFIHLGSKNTDSVLSPRNRNILSNTGFNPNQTYENHFQNKMTPSFHKVVVKKLSSFTANNSYQGSTRISPVRQGFVSQMSPRKNSPVNSPRLNISPNKVMEYCGFKEENQQLNRKVKILESRVNQLHRQKQQILMNINADRQKIVKENKFLKDQVSQYERRFLELTTSQKNNLEQMMKNRKLAESKIGEILKRDDQDDNTSLQCSLLQRQSRLSEKPEINKTKSQNEANAAFQAKIQQLETQNTGLKSELQDLKQNINQNNIEKQQQIIEIQKNHKLIVESYEKNMKKIQEQLKQLMEEKESIQNLYDSYLQNSIKEKQQIEAQSNNKEKQLQKLLSQAKSELQQQKSQLSSLHKSYELIKQEKSGKKECLKCKQLIKTLIKLNQKTSNSLTCVSGSQSELSSVRKSETN